MKGEVKRTFNPEFLNRLDEVIIFTALSNTDLMQILELLVQQLNTNLVHKAITLSVNDEAKRWILEKTVVGSELRGTAAAPRTAALRRGSSVGGADRRRYRRSGRRSSRSTWTPTSCTIGRLRRTAKRRSPAWS